MRAAVGGDADTTPGGDNPAATITNGARAVDEVSPVGGESARPGGVAPATGRGPARTAGSQGQLPGRAGPARSAHDGIAGGADARGTESRFPDGTAGGRGQASRRSGKAGGRNSPAPQ